MATDRLISIRLSSDELDRLQQLADRAGITRHKLITNLVTTGLEALEDIDKIGLFRASIMARNAGERIQSMLKGKPKDESDDQERSA